MPDARDTLYYDGACGFCQRSARFLQALDWRDRLCFKDMTGVPDEELPVSRADAIRAIPMKTRDGRALSGFDAVRRAMMQTPPGVLVAWAMYLPGVPQIGRRVYRFIADRRHRRGTACPTHPGVSCRVQDQR